MTKLSRRKFIKNSSAVASGIYIVPRSVLGKGYVPPSDQLNVAGIGIGGRGHSLVVGASKHKFVNIAALCDVDTKFAGKVFDKFPKAKKYTDYRKLAENAKDIDAIMVATPDNTHAVVSMAFMKQGIHTYLEKPMAHDIYEVRRLTEVAKEKNLVTQMGNFGSSGEGIRKICEWIWAGVIGDVHTVHCWTNRPVWPQGKPHPSDRPAIPSELDWDLWQGPAKERNYHPAYTHFKWRGWWDYGTGALGDMGCHITDNVFKSLKLGYPTEVEASVTTNWVGDFVEADYPDSCPPSSIVKMKFPAREGMPEVTLKWYDGGLMPDRPEELAEGEELGNWDGGALYEGTRGKIVCGCYGIEPRLLPSSRMDYFKEPEPTLSRVEGNGDGHITQFLEACRTGGETSSPFSIAGPLSEGILMGNLAIRSAQMKRLKKGKTPTSWAPYAYPGRKKLFWDGANMKITNFDEANAFVRREYRDGYSL